MGKGSPHHKDHHRTAPAGPARCPHHLLLSAHWCPCCPRRSQRCRRPQSPPPPRVQCADACTVWPPRARGQARGLWGASTEGVLGRSRDRGGPAACCAAALLLTREPAGGLSTAGRGESEEVPELSGVPVGARSGDRWAGPATARHGRGGPGWHQPSPESHALARSARETRPCREHRHPQGRGAVAGHLGAQGEPAATARNGARCRLLAGPRVGWPRRVSLGSDGLGRWRTDVPRGSQAQT